MSFYGSRRCHELYQEGCLECVVSTQYGSPPRLPDPDEICQMHHVRAGDCKLPHAPVLQPDRENFVCDSPPAPSPEHDLWAKGWSHLED